MLGGGAAASSATLVGLEAMKVTELRSRCAALGEPTDGRKVDLVARLYTAVTRRPPPHGAGPPPRHKRKRPLEEGDERLVNEVRGYMKANKLSQVMVGQEARISQVVISPGAVSTAVAEPPSTAASTNPDVDVLCHSRRVRSIDSL